MNFLKQYKFLAELRYLGDHAIFEPSKYHEAADEIERLAKENRELSKENAKLNMYDRLTGKSARRCFGITEGSVWTHPKLGLCMVYDFTNLGIDSKVSDTAARVSFVDARGDTWSLPIVEWFWVAVPDGPEPQKYKKGSMAPLEEPTWLSSYRPGPSEDRPA